METRSYKVTVSRPDGSQRVEIVGYDGLYRALQMSGMGIAPAYKMARSFEHQGRTEPHTHGRTTVEIA